MRPMRTVAPAVARCLPQIAAAIDAVAARLAAGGRLIYMGAGTSGRLGLLDAAECPPTFNTPPGRSSAASPGGPGALGAAVEGVEDDPDARRGRCRGAGSPAPGMRVVGLTASGRTPYVRGALAAARAAGALDHRHRLQRRPGDRPRGRPHHRHRDRPRGDRRVDAAQGRHGAKDGAQHVSTGVMVRLGKTYGALMVDVQPTNAKLRRRAARIVATATGLPARGGDPAAGRGERRDQDGDRRRADRRHAGRGPRAPGPHGRPRAGRPRPAAAVTQPARPSRAGAGPCFLGVDGGGTHTRAVLVDARGREIGRGQAAGANWASVGVAAALANIQRAVAAARAAAGVAGPARAAWCGLAGVDRPADRALIAPGLRDLAATLRLTNDAELALAVLPDRAGVCLVAGTGSIAVGRAPDGRTARAGGWGHVLGDEGSGYDIGRQALLAVARAADGRGPATALTARHPRGLGSGGALRPDRRGLWRPRPRGARGPRSAGVRDRAGGGCRRGRNRGPGGARARGRGGRGRRAPGVGGAPATRPGRRPARRPSGLRGRGRGGNRRGRARWARWPPRPTRPTRPRSRWPGSTPGPGPTPPDRRPARRRGPVVYFPHARAAGTADADPFRGGGAAPARRPAVRRPSSWPRLRPDAASARAGPWGAPESTHCGRRRRPARRNRGLASTH